MADDMDVNCGTILDGAESVQECGQRIFELMLRVASGERTRVSQFDFGAAEFAPWVLGANDVALRLTERLPWRVSKASNNPAGNGSSFLSGCAKPLSQDRPIRVHGYRKQASVPVTTSPSVRATVTPALSSISRRSACNSKTRVIASRSPACIVRRMGSSISSVLNALPTRQDVRTHERNACRAFPADRARARHGRGHHPHA